MKFLSGVLFCIFFIDQISAEAQSCQPTGQKLPENSLTFEIHPNVLKLGWGRAVRHSADQWNDAGSPFKFNYVTASGLTPNVVKVAETPQEKEAYQKWDQLLLGKNGKSGGMAFPKPPHASALIWFNPDISLLRATARIVKAEKKYDVYGVIIHELGHLLILEHVEDAQCVGKTVMFHVLEAGENNRRIVTENDKNAINKLYQPN